MLHQKSLFLQEKALFFENVDYFLAFIVNGVGIL